MRRTLSLCLLVSALVLLGTGALGLWVQASAGAESAATERELALRLTETIRDAVKRLVPDSPLAGPDADPFLLFGGLLALGAVAALVAFLVRASVLRPRAQEAGGTSGRRASGWLPVRARGSARRRAVGIEAQEGPARAGDFLRTEGLLEESAQLFLRNELYAPAAEVRHDQNRFEEAAELYERAGRPEAAAAIFGRLSQFEQAARCYLAADLPSVAAQMFERASRFEQAAECYLAGGLHVQAAEAFLGAGMRERAAGALVSAFEAEAPPGGREGDAPALDREALGRRAAELLSELGDSEAAERILARAGAYSRAAQVALDAGKSDAASEWFLRAGRADLAADVCERAGDAVQAARLRGRYLRETGDVANASRYLREAGEFAEAAELHRDAGEFARAGDCYWECKDYPAAAEMFSAAEAHERAAEAFERCERFDEAAGAFERAGDSDRHSEMLARAGKPIDAGRLQAARGKVDEAIRALQQVERGQPGFVEACVLLGELFEQKGMETLSLRKLEEAMLGETIAAGNLEAYYLLAQGLRQHGRLPEALEVLEKLLSFEFHYRDVSTLVNQIKAEIEMSGSPLLEVSSGRGRYRVIRELGRGGMGVVHLARDTVLDREVALKVLPEDMRGNENAVRSFLREAKSAAQLNHPNIVTVYDAGDEGGLYLAMEYVAGRNMKELIREQGAFPVDTVLQIIEQMAEALAYAHSRRVVHRDIKTANTMWTPEGKVKIMDFGLAKVLQEVRNATTLVSGTPYYMSPEQAQGRDVDHQTDLYSLGVTLFELSTGKLPFPEGNVPYHHVHTVPPAPRSLRAELPPELDQLILKCVEKDPSNRYASATELLEEFRLGFSSASA